MNQAIREDIAAAMNEYAKGGLKALGSYRDRAKAFDLYDATKEMIDSSYYLSKAEVPEIYNHVAEYPAGTMADAEDIFYWENIDFGQGPVIRVSHLSLFNKGADAAAVIASNNQLYASKYIRVGLQMFYCVPDTEDKSKKGFYLLEMNDSRLPDFSGLKLGIVRSVATGKAIEGTHDTLAFFKRRMENN